MSIFIILIFIHLFLNNINGKAKIFQNFVDKTHSESERAIFSNKFGEYVYKRSILSLPNLNLKPSKINDNFILASMAQNFSEALNASMLYKNTFSFGSFYSNSKIINGTQAQWISFIYSSLNIPFSGAYISSLSISHQFNDYLGGQSSFFETCTQQNVINSIVRSLWLNENYFGYCNGTVWRVLICHNAPVLCVNCRHNSCQSDAVCPGNAIVINPSSQCKNNLSAFSIFSARYNIDNNSPTISGLYLSDVTKNSVKVILKVDRPGIAYCAAFFANLQIDPTIALKSVSYPKLVYPNISNVYSIGSLLTETSYDIYCLTEDGYGQAMSAPEILKTKLSFKTNCCRGLHMKSLSSSIATQYPGSEISAFEFVFELDSQPLNLTHLNISFYSYDCSTHNLLDIKPPVNAYPNSFVLAPKLLDLQMSFIIQSSQRGCFSASIRSISGTFYNPTHFNFSVYSYLLPPLSPVFLEAIASNDMLGLYLKFDSPTNFGAPWTNESMGIFVCSDLFEFIDSQFFDCLWENSTVVFAFPKNSSYSFNIGDIVTIRYGNIKAKCNQLANCDQFPYSPMASKPIQPPTSPIIPKVLLFSTSQISSGDHWEIDPTASQGAMGRPWKQIYWNVSGNSSSPNSFSGPLSLTTEISNLEKYLNKNFHNTSSKIVIPNQYLQSGGRYFVSLTLVNLFSLSSIATVSVEVDSNDSISRPRINLYSTQTSIGRSDSLSLFADVSMPSCMTFKYPNYSLFFQWKVYANEIEYQPLIQSISADPRHFRLAPFTLAAGLKYQIVSMVGAKVNQTMVSYSQEYLSVFVRWQGVFAYLTGGDSIYGFTGELIVLNASLSYDIDYPYEKLSFVWKCMGLGSIYGENCQNFPSSTSSPILRIPSSRSMLPGTYRIEVFVSNSRGLVSSAKQKLTISSSQLDPDVAWDFLPRKVDPANKIILSGKVNCSFGPCRLHWGCPSIQDSNLFASSTLSPVSTLLSTGIHFVELALKPNFFTPRQAYTFSLTSNYLSLKSQSQLASSITITMNQPPYSGFFIVSPTTGKALFTDFLFSTGMWNDDIDDFPLQYMFSYYLTDKNKQLAINSPSQVPYTRSKLGEGLFSLDHKVFCVVLASDIYWSSSNLTRTVVSSPQTTTHQLVNQFNFAIQSAFDANDSAQVLALIGASVQSLNRVNCPLLGYCTSLNRHPCLYIQNTCGSCLPGYLGVDGDSNLPCKQPNLWKTFGSVCSLNEDCLTGVCTDGKCQALPKACPNNCSNQGKCIYLGHDMNPRSSCSLVDPTCFSKCSCLNGSYGMDCSLSASDFQVKIQFREKLCKYFLHTIDSQDPSGIVIQSRANTIETLFADIDQISQQTYVDCSQVMIRTVISNPILSCQTSNVLNSVVRSFSSIISVASTASFLKLQSKAFLESASNISKALSILSQGCQSQIIAGESPLTSHSENIRLVINSVHPSNQENLSLYLPESSFESFNDIQISRLLVRQNQSINAFSSPNVPMDVSMIQFEQGFFQSGYGGSIIGLQISFRNGIDAVPSHQYSAADHVVMQSARRLKSRQIRTKIASQNLATVSYIPISKEILIINESPMEYLSPVDEFVIARCFDKKRHNYSTYADCSGGLRQKLTCPPNKKGYFNVSCPKNASFPVCTKWNGSVYIPTPLCEVVSFTPERTLCRCHNFINLTQRGGGILNFEYEYYSIGVSFVQYNSQSSYISYSSTETDSSFAFWLFVSVGIFVFLLFLLVLKASIQHRRAKRQREFDQFFQFSLAQEKKTSDSRSVRGFFEGLWPGIFRRHPIRLYSLKILRECHSLMRVLRPDASDLQEISMFKYYVLFLVKLTSILALNSLLISFFYMDNGECSHQFDSIACENTKTLFGFDSVCQWTQELHECTFSSRTIDPYIIIVYSGVVLLALIIYSNIMELVVLFIFYRLTAEGSFFPSFSFLNKGSFMLCDTNKDQSDLKENAQGLPPRHRYQASIKGEDFWSRGDVDPESNPSDGLVDGNLIEKVDQIPPLITYQETSRVHSVELPRNDEFLFWQTQRVKFIKAVRHALLEKVVSSSSFQEELSLLREEMQFILEQSTQMRQNKLSELLEHEMNRSNRMNIVEFFDLHYLLKSNHLKNVLKSARHECERISNHLSQLETLVERESYLAQQYFVHLLRDPGVRSVATFALDLQQQPHGAGFLRIDQFSSPQSRAVLLLMAFLVLLSHFSICLLYIVYFQENLRYFNHNFWLATIFIQLAAYYTVIEPSCLVFFWVSIVNNLIGQKYLSVYTQSHAKFAKLVMIRSSGYTKMANSIIQHLNPACRAALFYPEMSVSRWLFSIFDNDICLDKAFHIKRKGDNIYPLKQNTENLNINSSGEVRDRASLGYDPNGIATQLASLVSAYLKFVPSCFFQLVLETLMGFIYFGLALLFYFLYKIHPLWCLIALIVVVCTLLYRELIILFNPNLRCLYYGNLNFFPSPLLYFKNKPSKSAQYIWQDRFSLPKQAHPKPTNSYEHVQKPLEPFPTSMVRLSKNNSNYSFARPRFFTDAPLYPIVGPPIGTKPREFDKDSHDEKYQNEKILKRFEKVQSSLVPVEENDGTLDPKRMDLLTLGALNTEEIVHDPLELSALSQEEYRNTILRQLTPDLGLGPPKQTHSISSVKEVPGRIFSFDNSYGSNPANELDEYQSQNDQDAREDLQELENETRDEDIARPSQPSRPGIGISMPSYRQYLKAAKSISPMPQTNLPGPFSAVKREDIVTPMQLQKHGRLLSHDNPKNEKKITALQTKQESTEKPAKTQLAPAPTVSNEKREFIRSLDGHYSSQRLKFRIWRARQIKANKVHSEEKKEDISHSGPGPKVDPDLELLDDNKRLFDCIVPFDYQEDAPAVDVLKRFDGEFYVRHLIPEAPSPSHTNEFTTQNLPFSALERDLSSLTPMNLFPLHSYSRFRPERRIRHHHNYHRNQYALTGKRIAANQGDLLLTNEEREQRDQSNQYSKPEDRYLLSLEVESQT